MNKYLIEILKLQNSVILPGLGALMIPSQKTGKVFFNEHLKFNDGSLARYLAEKEGVELQEAQNKVAKFVREIEAQIGKGEAYDMFEFGKFFKDETGDVKFEMSPLFIANIEIPNPETLVSSAKSAVIPPLAPSNETEHLATQKEAEAKIAENNASGTWFKPIVTQVEPLTLFHPAEEYHQHYFTNNPEQGYCQAVVAPKVAKLRKHFPEIAS